jgi:hypothetical protein
VRWLVRTASLALSTSGALAVGVAAGALRGQRAPVPSLGPGAAAPVPVVAVLALLPVAAAFWSWSRLPTAALAVSVRHPVGHVVCLLAAPAGFAVGAAVTGGCGGLIENARNALGLLGLGLVGVRLLGGRGAVVVPATFLLAAFVGGRTPGAPSPAAWAWVLHDAGHVPALVMAVALGGVGLALAGGLPPALVRRGETHG